jgi:hypothetical protein
LKLHPQDMPQLLTPLELCIEIPRILNNPMEVTTMRKKILAQSVRSTILSQWNMNMWRDKMLLKSNTFMNNLLKSATDKLKSDNKQLPERFKSFNQFPR